jgi:post-segregation antitoxin (ccd killing protein)
VSTREATKRTVFKNLRITEEMDKEYKELDINFSDTCRKAIQDEIEKLRPKRRPYHGGKVDHRNRNNRN